MQLVRGLFWHSSTYPDLESFLVDPTMGFQPQIVRKARQAKSIGFQIGYLETSNVRFNVWNHRTRVSALWEFRKETHTHIALTYLFASLTATCSGSELEVPPLFFQSC